MQGRDGGEEDNGLAVSVMLLVTVPIVVLCPLKLLHEAEALDVEFANLRVTELPLDPAWESELSAAKAVY